MQKLKKYIILSFAVILFSCSDIANNETIDSKIVPSRTPFISGIVESSLDSVFYYTQVTIGYVTDAHHAIPYYNVHHIPGLFSPTQWTQVVRTIERFELSYEFENNAVVSITGPKGHHTEETIFLENENFGVYGDLNYELNLLAGYNYELKVQLPDGRLYESETVIPDSVFIDIPDSLAFNVIYSPYEDGTPFERSISKIFIPIVSPKQTFIKEYQSNTNNDREYLLLEPEESFLFEDRGDFLRTGSAYGIQFNEAKVDTIYKGWWRDIYLPWTWEKPVDINWMRFAFYSNGMWRAHQNLDEYVSSFGDGWFNLYDETIDATQSRDSTYLFDVSTIQKLGENGELLPKEELDAIGFFAGNFSVYKKSVIYPVRNFDLDSVLTANGINR